MAEGPPGFTRAVDVALGRAASLVRALPSATPENAAEERRRLLDALRRGEACAPRWTYGRRGPSSEVAPLLLEAERALPRDTPLADAYAARIDEVAREAAIEAAIGTPELARAADARYLSLGAKTEAAADALAAAWREESIPAAEDERLVASDADDPDSLLVRMREEIGRLRLPFRVVLHGALASLAATGSDAIFVTEGRQLTHEAVERTVLHEIHGHAFPRARASHRAIGLFSFGTARGTDEQEGYALLLEERAGLLRGARRRELAARHAATRAMREGATFVEVVRGLVGDGVDDETALRVAERAFRGGDGTYPGLGRERVYLQALEHVRAWLERLPDDEAVIASGQVGTKAIAALRPFCEELDTGALGPRSFTAP